MLSPINSSNVLVYLKVYGKHFGILAGKQLYFTVCKLRLIDFLLTLALFKEVLLGFDIYQVFPIVIRHGV